MSPEQKRLRELLKKPAHTAVKKWLRDCAVWWDDTELTDDMGVTFVKAPVKKVDIWKVGDASSIVVVEGDVHVGNLITAGEAIENTVIFLGAIDATNVFNAPNMLVGCVEKCNVRDFMYVASSDAEFVTFGAAEIGVLYSGHGDGWLTARGPISVDVLDDHVEGSKVVAKRRKVTASEVVLASLGEEDGHLDRDAVFKAFTKTTALLRAPSATTASPTKKAVTKKAVTKKAVTKKAVTKKAVTKKAVTNKARR